jgi:hypothetical protein
MCEANPNPTTRLKLANLFKNKKEKQAFRHRLATCVRATNCGRLCDRLIKGLGKSEVYCTTYKIHLYSALEDPAFECPKGLF